MEKSIFSYSIDILRKTLFILFVFMIFMLLVRLYLYLHHSIKPTISSELFEAFFLGVRLDLSTIGFIFAPVLVFVIFLNLFKRDTFKIIGFNIVKYYLIIVLTIASLLIFSDIAYFSYFFEHITITVFGIIDDDTKALFEIAKKNYNLPLITTLLFIYFTLLYWFILKVFKNKATTNYDYSLKFKILFFTGAILLNFLAIRGTFSTFPITKNIPDISTDKLINSLPKNGVLAFVDAYKQYKRSKEDKYDLIAMSGYKNHIKDAFKLFLQKDDIDSNLTKNLIKTTPKNDYLKKHPKNVVIIMVESFGLPITKYQSSDFNIMGALKKHFKKDTLFTNFISTSNGTIASLEPLLLNITARPSSTPLAQSKYLNTTFKTAAALVFKKNGYETSFVYGGDLSWRNIGKFLSHQGFDNVYAKASIAKELNLDLKKSSHTWGVFDEFAHKFVLKKLKNAKKPQFIFLLTTNNHPPYTIPKWYKSKSLKISNNLKKHLVGDINLIKDRLKDYAYALDQVGIFLDKLKSSPLKNNTVVAITADNNTIEGNMRYDNFYDESKKIPFYLYMPKDVKKEFNTKLASSHKDIFPTLYNLVLSDTSYISIGNDLGNNRVWHCGFNDAGVIMSSDGGFEKNHPKTIEQKKCKKLYDSSLAVEGFLLQEQIKK